MIESLQPSKNDMKRLIEAELGAATYIPLRQALSPYLIEPFSRTLTWQYAQTPIKLSCWIIADLGFHKLGLMLAYSSHGHGSHGDPWGMVFASDTSFGRDDSWFTCLEDAFINSGAWTQPLPPDYAVR